MTNQGAKRLIKQLLKQYVTPKLIYDMYGISGLNDYAKSVGRTQDRQLDVIQGQILNKLKQQYIKELQYRIIRQARYFGSSFYNVSDTIGKAATGVQKQLQKLILVNNVFKWPNIKEDLQFTANIFFDIVQSMSQNDQGQEDIKRTQKMKRDLQNLIQSSIHYYKTNPNEQANLKRMRQLYSGTNLQDQWQLINSYLPKDQLEQMPNVIKRLAQIGRDLDNTDLGKYVNVFSDQFRNRPLQRARKYYQNSNLEIKDMYNLFNGLDWDSSFGGGRWYNIAQQYQKLKGITETKQLRAQLDHINDLVHNTGSVLNKFKFHKKILQALDDKFQATNVLQLLPKVTDPDIRRKIKEYRDIVGKVSQTKGTQDKNKSIEDSNYQFKEGDVVKYKYYQGLPSAPDWIITDLIPTSKGEKYKLTKKSDVISQSEKPDQIIVNTPEQLELVKRDDQLDKIIKSFEPQPQSSTLRTPPQQYKFSPGQTVLVDNWNNMKKIPGVVQNIKTGAKGKRIYTIKIQADTGFIHQVQFLQHQLQPMEWREFGS